MKKKLFLITAICFAVGMVKGQDSVTNCTIKSHGEAYIGYNQYGLQYGRPLFGGRLLKEVTPKWSIGGGFEFEFPYSIRTNKMEAAILPVNSFKVVSGRLGVYVTTSYQFNRGFVILDGWFGLNGIDIKAYDERCELDDGDNGITHWYKISRVDGKVWTRNVMGSIRLSYLLLITKNVGVRFMVGYNLWDCINKELVNDNTEIHSSNWQDFEQYYGQPTVNLYEASEAIRKVCAAGRFYYGINISLFE